MLVFVVVYRDLNTTHGSLVNGRSIQGGQSVVLKDGDVIQFAQDPQEFTFHYAGGGGERGAGRVMLDEKVSLTQNAPTTYAVVDHLSHSKTPSPLKTVGCVLLYF